MSKLLNCLVWQRAGRDPPEVRLLLFFLQRDQLGSIRTWNYRFDDQGCRIVTG
jgi:hypothetical protein